MQTMCQKEMKGPPGGAIRKPPGALQSDTVGKCSILLLADFWRALLRVHSPSLTFMANLVQEQRIGRQLDVHLKAGPSWDPLAALSGPP